MNALDGVSLLATKKESTYASVGFFMFGKELAHYHLSANNQDIAKENGNYLLLDAAFEHAKRHGCRYMMLGGGRTSSPDDSLFKFKSKFSPLTMPFYIAGLDFLPEKRQMLNQMWIDQSKDSTIPKLFQLYRA
ncbi:GNAT family N-acetyltransferase [Vibrio artabrorum]|uniref:GNAT family N-acetyltransferase n=1 Tax=Vibrio artabrorum TaxID=446374 RepID=A0ABT8CJ64_9VIBR|nr:GNAT family N-acetyltransferase [Vibrio artabrorum]MDN3700466.1 GNAT family N-acetyltransferase [Vibrio artabrorum]